MFLKKLDKNKRKDYANKTNNYKKEVASWTVEVQAVRRQVEVAMIMDNVRT